jgi:surfactin synthase thioesterase subunit/glycosyltransferase involved in cell wall biosynthesis
LRILLAANASYVPPRGGATRSNLIWLEHLAESGHECRIVAASLPGNAAEKQRQMREEDLDKRWRLVSAEGGVEVFVRPGIEVFSTTDAARQAALLREQIREFQPDWVLVSSEDLGHVLLREAARCAPGRLIYIAHTPQFFPFGPESWNPDPEATKLVRNAVGVIAIGNHMAGYIQQHTGRGAEVIHPPIYGDPPFARYRNFGIGYITMVNPSAVKGAPVLLELAGRFPDAPFAILPGWGTTADDLQEIGKRANISVLANCRNIEQVLEKTRILLMPSLWYEGFGLIVMEAMLRGIPVIASDSGGLVEAKMGTGFVVPAGGIERYEPVFDERGLPRPVLRETDIEPWVEALNTLLTDREIYERESEVSRQSAIAFVGSLRASRMEEYLLALPPVAPMRILLAHNSLYYPSHGGGDKSNRILMESLAARGHTCRVVARTGSFSEEAHDEFLAQLGQREVQVDSEQDGVVSFRHNGVDVHVATRHPNFRQYFAAQIEEFQPRVILTSTDDPAQLLLEAALRAAESRVVYLTRATLPLPFGPDCAFPSDTKSETLHHVDAIACVSEYVAGYVRKYGEMEAAHVPISLLEPSSADRLGRFDNEFVTIANPCAVKGISIFLALATRMPQIQFAAIPTWGTNEDDRRALQSHPNITILDPVDNIEDLLERTRVLLVPSLWAEARSRIVGEAMLRGVPVIASKTGGIPEAKLGVPYLIPVNTIRKYEMRLDEQMVPVAEVPEQDIAPWQAALERLTSSREHYEAISTASREAAMRYASRLSVVPFERMLDHYNRLPAKPRTLEHARSHHAAIDKLSAQQRQLLALRLRKLNAAKWFPSAGAAPDARLRLFAFPHAGGGVSAYAHWQGQLPADVALIPARYPGRESRSGEPLLGSMEELVHAAADAIGPFLNRPFAFFGHSMGAVVAFELARYLRRHGKPAPAALYVAGARAPRYRLNWKPPAKPSEAEFLAELRRLEGVPDEVLENEELTRILLPVLAADTALYRNYIYHDEPPLLCPIHVYGGAADPNVTREHLDAWSGHTRGETSVKVFEGGHFFLQSNREEFLAALVSDLR